MKTLVITSCCKKKLNHSAPAGQLYLGNLFKAAKKFSERKCYDLMIISAKHGLVSPSQILEPYDKVLKTKKDIEHIRPNVIENLKKILPGYDKVIVIAGIKYRKTIESIIDSRFEIITAEGYGKFVKKVNGL